MKPPPAAYTLIHGASWLTETGEVLPIPSFHEEWILSHPELAGEAKNVCELVLAKRWISVALFQGGYVELLVHDRHDAGVGERIFRLLSGAVGRWGKALIMAMDEEGYVMLEPADLESPASLATALNRKL